VSVQVNLHSTRQAIFCVFQSKKVVFSLFRLKFVGWKRNWIPLLPAAPRNLCRCYETMGLRITFQNP
jgi:hypothetical protein